MESSSAQSLLNRIIINGPLKERKVRPLVQQLVRTLSLLHKHGVVHRNLKIENIYVGPTGQAILTDFARATTFSGPLTERTSAQHSPAPELLLPPTAKADAPQAPYAAAPVDVWGLGVVLHILACHFVPFDAPTSAAMHEASRRSPEGLRFPARVSDDCRDLIRRMLEADPAARASLDEVLAHPWMNPTPGPRSPLGAYKAAKVTTYAALRWPEKVDHSLFRTPDDARRNENLTDILGLVARVCEAPNSGRPTWLLDLTWTPVVPGLRSRAALHWTSLFRALKGRRQTKPR
ncbi:kinase-like domain-containing protein [Lactarius psammicola]|nr:kinase-like domain-containing protein [Lactarius psammicola]